MCRVMLRESRSGPLSPSFPSLCPLLSPPSFPSLPSVPSSCCWSSSCSETRGQPEGLLLPWGLQCSLPALPFCCRELREEADRVLAGGAHLTGPDPQDHAAEEHPSLPQGVLSSSSAAPALSPAAAGILESSRRLRVCPPPPPPWPRESQREGETDTHTHSEREREGGRERDRHRHRHSLRERWPSSPPSPSSTCPVDPHAPNGGP